MKRPTWWRLTILTALAAFVLAIPASASATTWTKSGTALSSPKTVTVSGPVSLKWYLGQVNEVRCTMSGQAVLAPSNHFWTSGLHVQPGTCHTLGVYNEYQCKVNTGTSYLHFKGSPEANESKRISFSGAELYFDLSGCNFIQGVEAGAFEAIPNNSEKISTLSFEKSGEWHSATPVYLNGALTMSPAETYGIAEGTNTGLGWTEEGKLLSGEKSVEISGKVGFASSAGTLTCSVAGSATLKSAGGWFGFSYPEFVGGYWHTVGAKPCEGAQAFAGCQAPEAIGTNVWTNGPGFPTDEGTIGWQELIGEYAMKSCLISKIRFESTPGQPFYYTVDNSKEISQISFSTSGTWNGLPSGSKVPATLSGTLNVTPAKKYGIG